MFEFQPLGSREVVADFSGGMVTSDGGVLLLRETEARTGIIRRFAKCFRDHRDPDCIEHTVEELVGQRVYGLALGHEDLNDHDDLRHDPLLATVVGKIDPTGATRARERDRGKALAGKSTLNRLELTPANATSESRYKKIVAHDEEMADVFVDTFLSLTRTPPKMLWLDLDATDDPVHGDQEGKFFHGYYGHYCYLPLYIFCGKHLLCAKLRTANRDASHGSLEEVQRIVRLIRAKWAAVKIVLRADSGFERDEIMSWCEEHGHFYLFGLAKNARLEKMFEQEMEEAKRQYEETKVPARVFADFPYRTLDSWSRERRVVGKAEYLSNGANPRFVVTNIPAKEREAKPLYEEDYCARGEAENRIKEQQLELFADRTSTHEMRSNQLRLWFSSVTYTLMNALRDLGMAKTEMARAQCGTIRTRLLKIGALVKVSVRRVYAAMSEAFPRKELFEAIYRALGEVAPIVGAT